jgi:tripartite-type tricarboxylate transporter receptor subunit TctC
LEVVREQAKNSGELPNRDTSGSKMTRAADHIRVQALGVVISLAAVAGGADAARAQPATDFFAGRQVSVLIGATAGGGYDVYARALSRHMGRHLPGQPTLIPKNVPGAGGLTLANHLYNRAPADGTEFAIVQNGLPFEKLFQTLSPEGRNALFDATRFGWIGSITRTVFVTVTWHSAPVKTLADATRQQAVLGASATSSDSYVLAMLSNRLLGTKFKVVHGYPGAAEVDLAVENGEVEGEAGKDWTTLTSTRPQWIKDKKINILVQMGMRAHADLAAVPMAIDLAKTAEDRQVMEVVFAKFGMSRPFLTPPGIAPERLSALRRAFDATMQDPAFLADAAKLGMEVNPVRGEEVEALVTRMMGTPPEIAQRTRDVLKPQ